MFLCNDLLFRSSKNHNMRNVSCLSRNPGDDKFLQTPLVVRATALDPLFRSSVPVRCHISCYPRYAMRQFSESRENQRTINGFADRRHCFGLVYSAIPKCATTVVCRAIITAVCDDKPEVFLQIGA